METITDVQPPISDAERLEAPGAPITLATGETVRLRYGGRAQRFLERKYGSLRRFQDALMGEDERNERTNKLREEVEQLRAEGKETEARNKETEATQLLVADNLEGDTLTALFDALYAGMLHLKLGNDVDDVLDLLDERRLHEEYLPAFRRAFAQALPRRAQESNDEIAETPTTTTDTPNSPGPNSNTSPAPNSESVSASSGT